LVCLTKTARCDGYSTIAFGLADVIGLSALPDGRLLFIEGGRQVRVIENGRLLPEPALTVPAEATLAGLAVDRAFDQTRFVFVAWAEVNNNGEHRLNITRYRELVGTLGEGARIVTHLPFRPEARAPLAVDDASFLYVAVPSQQELFRSTGQAALPTGSVLRFTRDGLSAGSSRASPLIAYGYPRPTSLVVDAANGDLWLAGMEADQSAQFSRVDIDRKSTGRVPTVRAPESINHRVSAPSRFEPTLTIVRSAGRGQQPLVVVGADGQLLQGMISAEGKIDGLVPLATGQAVPLHAAAQTPDGSLYVVAGETGQTFVLRLTEW
jgi:hypothetical protein